MTAGPLTDEERAAARSSFSCAMANLWDASIYWHPHQRRILCRSTIARKRFRVPMDAVLIGRYSRPFSASEFIRDLEQRLKTAL